MANGYNNKAEHDVDRLLDALERYGKHDEDCPAHDEKGVVCICGLSEVLENQTRYGY